MSEYEFKIEAGGIYLDGNGKVHGPLDSHPSQPELFLIATGATYYHDGRHTSGDLSPGHTGLNLVRRVIVVYVEQASEVATCPLCLGPASPGRHCDTGDFCVACDSDDCGTIGPSRHTGREALAVWNRRAAVAISSHPLFGTAIDVGVS